VFHRVGRIATISALCCAIGLHWIALQSIAWTTMIVSYAKQQSVCIAIVQTFDGAHPCSLCHAVSKGKTSEKKSDLQALTPKFDLICVARAIRVLPLFAPFDYGTCSFSLSEIRHSPPVPPPRFQVS
jgi:hypothetical protein